jgi:hypothetical protein
VRLAEVAPFHPRFTFFLPIPRAITSEYSFQVIKKNKRKRQQRAPLIRERGSFQLNLDRIFSSASRLDGELLQVLVIGDVGGDGVADDIRRLFAIGLLPLGVELLVGLGDFLLRCY